MTTRDEDIVRYIEIVRKKIPTFLRRLGSQLQGYITYDDIESETMFDIIKHYDRIKKFETENPDIFGRYMFGVIKYSVLHLIRKEVKHQQKRVKVQSGENEEGNDKLEENKIFVDNKNPENIKEDKEDIVKQLNISCENLNRLCGLIVKVNKSKIKIITKKGQLYRIGLDKFYTVYKRTVSLRQAKVHGDIRYSRQNFKIKKGKINDKRFFTSIGIK